MRFVELGIVIEMPPETTLAPCGLARAVVAPSAVPAANATAVRAARQPRNSTGDFVVLGELIIMGETRQ
ncbi:MAG TPA: hypothetical protein VFC56_11075 [Stellaceae bacterium]|nr:hypothetical protein [Stellaceae bacterium]